MSQYMDLKYLQKHFKLSESSPSGVVWIITFITGHVEIINVGDAADRWVSHRSYK